MNKNEEKKVFEELKARLIKYFDEVENDEEINEGDKIENIISLTDETGTESDFELLDLIEYKGEEYVVLLPVENSDEPGEVVILKLVSSEDDKVEESMSALMMTKPLKPSLRFSKQNSQMSSISLIKNAYCIKFLKDVSL